MPLWTSLEIQTNVSRPIGKQLPLHDPSHFLPCPLDLRKTSLPLRPHLVFRRRGSIAHSSGKAIDGNGIAEITRRLRRCNRKKKTCFFFLGRSRPFDEIFSLRFNQSIALLAEEHQQQGRNYFVGGGTDYGRLRVASSQRHRLYLS